MTDDADNNVNDATDDDTNGDATDTDATTDKDDMYQTDTDAMSAAIQFAVVGGVLTAGVVLTRKMSKKQN